MNFASSLISNSVTISSYASVPGNFNEGIYTVDGENAPLAYSRLQIDNSDITDSTALSNFVNFVSGTSTVGNAINWKGSQDITRSW